jgi:hypothetical protein
MALESALALVLRNPDALITAAKVASGACLGLVAWLFADRLARGRAATPLCAAFGLLVFANAGHGFHVNSAMETVAFCAATLLVVWSRDRGQTLLAGYLWAALAVLIRPEGLLLTPVLAGVDLRAGKRKAALVGCSVVTLTLLALFLILVTTYASPIPSAFSIKLGDPYPKRYGVLSVAFFTTLCAPAFLAGCLVSARRGHATSKLALAMASVLMAFFCFLQPIMNDCFRYEWPPLFLAAFGAVPIIEDKAAVNRRLLAGTAVLCTIVNLRTSRIALDRARDDVAFGDMDRNIGLVLAHSIRPGDWLSVLDAGMVPYFADVPTHDAVGLADGSAARRGPPYLGYDQVLMAFCRPDLAVVVVSLSDDDGETPRVLRACGFHTRIDVPISRCGAQWLVKAVFARDGVQLDGRALIGGRDFTVQCPWETEDEGMNLRSWKTWLSWDGATG